MTDPIHIMLDLETWGKKPGCDLRSIGACVFDPTSGFIHDGSLGTIKPYYQAVDNPVYTGCPHCLAQTLHDGEDCQPIRKYDLHRDPETVAWWNDQSDEANAAFADPVDLADGLRGFATWLDTAAMQFADEDGPDHPRIWAHGPQFDCTIAAAAYDACGLPVPWHYRAPRDTRTIFDAAGITDHSAWLEAHPGPLHILHHALDDAICQARAVCTASAIIAGWKHGHDDNKANILFDKLHHGEQS